MSPTTTTLYRVDDLEALIREAPAEALPPVEARPDTHPWAAIGIALVSALAFATSGSFAKALLDTGWTSGAAVLVRIGGAALTLTVPACLLLRGRWGALVRHAPVILGYGIVAVAASQLFFFTAVDHLSVGVALLLEYFSPVLLVGYLWATTRRAPAVTTVVGAGLATAGLALVIDLFGGLTVDAAGLGWGLAAACCAVAYYVLGARPTPGLPPLALAWAGMTVATLTLGAAGLLGLVPMTFRADDVTLAGHLAPVWVPVAGLAVVAGALSYSAGIAAARRLGSTIASFLSLTEVVFAIGVAYVVVGEVPARLQLAGTALILAGVATVKLGESKA